MAATLIVLWPAAVPGVVILLAGLLLPDSPASYAERGMLNKAQAVRAPRTINPDPKACMHLLHVRSLNKKGAQCMAGVCDDSVASESRKHAFLVLLPVG